MAAVRELEITCDGVRSPYIESGPTGSEEAVVYVHGNPGSSEDWRDFVGRTGEFARAIAIDMPGFGRAQKPHPHKFDYTAGGLGIHLAHLLEQLGVKRAHFVGHDFGGPFSIFAAMFDLSRVGSLAFINTGLLRGYRWHFWARVWRTPVIGEAVMLLSTQQAFSKTADELPQEMIDRMWSDFDMATRRVILRLYRTTDLEDQAMYVPLLRAANLPATVIFGKDDKYIPAKFAERTREGFPDAEINLVENAGHWPFVDRPDAVADLLFPFLQKQLAS